MNFRIDAALLGNGTSGWVQLHVTTGGVVENGGKKFEVTADDIAAYAEYIRANPDRIPIDYDHSYAEGSGTRAAGWIDASQVEVRNGDELWAVVDWTPAAAQAIKDGEYRYISPEFSFKSRKDGVLRKAAEFLAATLTNRPFLRTMAPVSLSEAKTDPDEGASMSKALTTALGLAEDADEKTIATAIKERDDKVVAAEKAATDAAEKLVAAQTELDALKATASDADKELTGLKTTVAQLLKDAHDSKVGALLDKAITDTKMDPAEREAMLAIAEKSGVDTVEALINARPARPLNTGKGGGGEGMSSDMKLTTTIDGVETPIDPDSAELAAKVDAYILALKLDREPTVEDYIRAHDAVLALA